MIFIQLTIFFFRFSVSLPLKSAFTKRYAIISNRFFFFFELMMNFELIIQKILSLYILLFRFHVKCIKKICLVFCNRFTYTRNEIESNTFKPRQTYI